MNNYRTIKLPDCCAVCIYYDDYYDHHKPCIVKPNKIKKVDKNGLCDKFEREE